MSNLLTLQTGKYAIKLENFEGPLDLLCMLIEKNKMDIYDIKIDEIDMVSKEDFVVCVSSAGYIKKHSLKSFAANNQEFNRYVNNSIVSVCWN